MIKKILIFTAFLIALTIVFSTSQSTNKMYNKGYAQENSTCDGYELNSTAVTMFNLDTSQVLCQVNQSEMLNLATLSKLIVVYMVLNEIDNNKISLDDQLLISEYGYALSGSPVLDYYFDLGNYFYTVEDLLKTIMVYSSPTAALTLAEYIAGINDMEPSEKSFIELATQRLQNIGLTSFELYNSTGLYNKNLCSIALSSNDNANTDIMYSNLFDESGVCNNNYNKMSAYDLSLLTYNIYKSPNVSYINQYYALESFTLNENSTAPSGEHERFNRNQIGIDGELGLAFTNNYTPDGSFDTSSLVSTINNNGVRYGIVILESISETEDESKGNIKTDLNNLSTSATNDYRHLPISSIGNWDLPVYAGKHNNVAILPTQERYIFIHNSYSPSDIPISYNISSTYNYNGYVKAPFNNSDILGEARVNLEQFTFLNNENTLSVDFKAESNVKRANIFKQIPILTMKALDSFVNWIKKVF